MPRQNNTVKNIISAARGVTRVRSLGAVDIHFHGAFGIDLFNESADRLDELSQRLWQKGVAAFCPTTLSMPPAELGDAVERLGHWIRSRRPHPRGALPLGIHLEGPFLNAVACGAHPPRNIRPFSFSELKRLWERSGSTLKIVTLAPEKIAPAELRKLARWCRDRKIALALGHSRATETQARQAFELGVTGLTHGWNALPFHHRDPGPMGAALGRRDVYIELILDQVHVSPTVIRWSRKLHAPDRVCLISDCVPAAETRGGRTYPFGPLQIQFHNRACRLQNGSLAGGGLLLTTSLSHWVQAEARYSGRGPVQVLKECLPSVTRAPLDALGISESKLAGYRVEWRIHRSGKIEVKPLL